MRTAKQQITRLTTAAGLLLALTLAAGCGGGSGAATSPNPQTSPPPVSNYTGPAPATEDVQRFKINVWDNLVPNNRCGTCHNESQAPRFVRSDDVNLAYDAANTVVDLSDPGSSIVVNKVRGGHNCWLTSNDACGDIIQSYIEAWASGAFGGTGKEIQLTAPPLQDPGSSKNFPDDSSLFAANVHPLLLQYCVGCHRDNAAVPQSPFFANADPDAAYEAAKAKIDLDTPANSRLVLRLRFESHNCWDNCQTNSNTMEAAIAAMSSGITPTQVDPNLVTSKALTLVNGIVASSGGRHEANVIAKYEFKTGIGTTAFDTSGVEPSLNLTLSGTYEWVGGWGINFTSGKAQGSTAASKKLHDLIKSTGEYSIEAWVAPGNVTQDGPARIITYSGGLDSRNFMLGQTLYNYDALNRSTTTGGDGEPRLSTADADEDLQATLQHVVVTFDPNNGRRIYVNGQFTGDDDSVTGGLLTDWDDTFAFALGSEVNNSNRWSGIVRQVAIHNRVLTPEQIQQNYDVGVGEKYYLLFNVSDHVGIADAYVVFEVSQFDSYGYLFNKPFFILLDGSAMPGNIPMEKMRIGINGREATVGQAYRNLNVTINDTDYAVEGRQYLSPLGTVIGIEKGTTDDEFFLTFERLGNSTNVVIEAPPAIPATPAPVPRPPAIGVRDFAEVDATLSRLTGVPASRAATLYASLKQSLPVDANVQGFLASHQMSITQLGFAYCDALVNDAALRAAFFPTFTSWNAAPATAFTTTGRDAIVNPLYDKMIGAGLSAQPSRTDVRAELDDLIDDLTTCSPNCAADRTEVVVKGACSAVLSSAGMMIQ
jgi:hypothetical protein